MSSPRDPLGDVFEDYLDNLCAPLVGIVPREERAALRAEVRDHLEALADEYTWQGESAGDAARAALREMGEPWPAGQAFLEAWLQGRHVRSSRLSALSIARPFGYFGVATMLTLLALEQYALTPVGDAWLPLFVVLATLSPLAAGALTGAGTPARLAFGTAGAVLILALDSAATGLLMLPSLDGLRFAAFQLAWWLPAGVLSGVLTAALTRSHRRNRFLHRVADLPTDGVPAD